MSTRIVALAGSARRESFNVKLIRVAARGIEKAGGECTVLDLREFGLPIYDGDLEAEAGLPEGAVRLREIFSSHQGLLVSTGEYNGSITPLLKNAIDWISRSPKATPDLSPYQGKIAALLSASPGPLGGMRGLGVVRALLGNIGVTVLPDQITLRQAHSAFDETGDLADEKQRERVEALGRKLVEWTARIHG
jgi:NAD(P)H-dependent FMN reductase